MKQIEIRNPLFVYLRLFFDEIIEGEKIDRYWNLRDSDLRRLFYQRIKIREELWFKPK